MYFRLQGLRREELARVEKANNLYDLAFDIVAYLHKRQCMWSMGNPWTSRFWLLPRAVSLLSTSGVLDTAFHNCMFSGRRKKLTRWVHNAPEFCELQRHCDDSHDHLPWGYDDGSHELGAKDEGWPSAPLECPGQSRSL